LIKLPLLDGAAAQTFSLHGPDADITAVAFDGAGRAYYTATGGDFGTLDLTHAATHRWYGNFAAANGLLFDRFSHDLMLVGHDRIVQIDPRTLGIVSELDLGRSFGRLLRADACNQASTNNRGSLIVACGRVVVLISLGADRGLASPDTRLTAQRMTYAVSHIAPTFTGTAGESRMVRRGCHHHCRPTPPVFTG
jgi:hypothetical protein